MGAPFSRIVNCAPNSIKKLILLPRLRFANMGYQRVSLTDQLFAQARQALDLAQERYKLCTSSTFVIAEMGTTCLKNSRWGFHACYRVS